LRILVLDFFVSSPITYYQLSNLNGYNVISPKLNSLSRAWCYRKYPPIESK